MGIGPGGAEHLTPAAQNAISSADTVVGYTRYVRFVEHLLEGKRVLASGMRAEVERAREAISEACAGRRVAVLSSGDAGIYGMAGLVLELQPDCPVEVVPGVSAAQAAAACLGAPLMNDFVCLSLSDLMTPLETILKRAHACNAGDFVVALYNPRSQTRHEPFERVIEIFRSARSPETPVGIVRNALREGQEVRLTALGALQAEDVDMLSILVVGNSATRILAGRMVTARGYLVEAEA